MRDPFDDLPSGCEDVEFDTEIVPATLPVCTLPPFTDATVAGRSFPTFSVPFLPSPWNCASWPSVYTLIEEPPLLGLDQLRISVMIGMADKDACGYDTTLELIASLPCLPLAIAATGTAEKLFDDSVICGADPGRIPQSPYLNVTGYFEPDCDLVLEVDAGIPCIMFQPSISVGVSLIPTGQPPQATGYVCVGGCQLDFVIELGIPAVTGPSGALYCVSHCFIASIWFTGGGLWQRTDCIDASCNYVSGTDTLVFQGVECP